jgi:hypothetical protein
MRDDDDVRDDEAHDDDDDTNVDGFPSSNGTVSNSGPTADALREDSEDAVATPGVCRVCLHDVSERDLELGIATAFGCACVDAFVHLSDECSDAYVEAKNPRCETVCEVCLSPARALRERVALRRKLAREERANGRRDDATTATIDRPRSSLRVAFDQETGSADVSSIENPNRPLATLGLRDVRRPSSLPRASSDRVVDLLCAPCVAGFACVACAHRYRVFVVFAALVSVGALVVVGSRA